MKPTILKNPRLGHDAKKAKTAPETCKSRPKATSLLCFLLGISALAPSKQEGQQETDLCCIHHQVQWLQDPRQ